MTCEEARGAFTDLYDGTLSGPPLVALSRHLDGCATCRRDWVAFRLTAGALEELRDEEPSPGFAARVVERIEAPRWWRRLGSSLAFPLRVKLPIHAAALVMLGVAGFWVSQRSPEIQRAADPGAPKVERSVTMSPPAPVAGVPAPEAKQAPRTPQPAANVPGSAPPAPAPSAAAKVEAPAIVREEKPAPSPPGRASPPVAEAPTSSLAKRSETEAPAPRFRQSARAPSDARDRSLVEGLAAPGTAAKEAQDCRARPAGRRTSCSPSLPRSSLPKAMPRPSWTCARSWPGSPRTGVPRTRSFSSPRPTVPSSSTPRRARSSRRSSTSIPRTGGPRRLSTDRGKWRWRRVTPPDAPSCARR